MVHNEADTRHLASRAIAAEITPPGRGAVSIVRVSAPDLDWLHAPLFGRELEPGVQLASVRDGDSSTLDKALVMLARNPASFTGEDVIECQLHGNPLIVTRLLSRLAELGIRGAEPGEFTRRAFLNGKLNLTQAEGMADLINASSDSQLRAAHQSYTGHFGARVDRLMATISDARMLVEATFDFSDEDIDEVTTARLRDQLCRAIADIDATLDECRLGVQLTSGTRAVLVGAPNAGKSSLFNNLIGEEQAIVTEEAGTTRDLIRAYIPALGVELIDTAGIRSSGAVGAVERIGMEKAQSAMELADLVIHVATPDCDWLPVQTSSQAHIYVCNQIDRFDAARIDARSKTHAGACIATSCLTGEGIDALRAALAEATGQQSHAPFAARSRHVQMLEDCLEALNAANDLIAPQGEVDEDEAHSGDLVIAAEELRRAHQCLGNITGQKTTPEAVLDDIFKRFCIGK